MIGLSWCFVIFRVLAFCLYSVSAHVVNLGRTSLYIAPGIEERSFERASVVDASPTPETDEQVSEAFHSMMHIPSSQPHRAHIGLTVSPDHKI